MTTRTMPGWGQIVRFLALAAFVPLAAFGIWQTAGAQEEAVVIPAPAIDLPAQGTLAKAVFAGGCFWGVQGVFQHVAGVKNAVSGYAGGPAEHARYDLVSTGQTAHAEAVEVTYDPTVISYGQLLQIYFSVGHNPTQLNYQGPDYGPQYRSAIFVASEKEREVAAAYIAQLDAAKAFPEPIVTTLEPLTVFYPAEEYHQDYLTLNPDAPYIVVHDLPKLAALKQVFPNVYQDDPILVSEAL